jgi:outer membrane protein assembly factor BamD (BamD/ComL family)
MKRILMATLAILLLTTIACNRKAGLEKEKARLAELRAQLYDKNSTLASQKIADEAIVEFRAFGNAFPDDSMGIRYHIEAAEIAWTVAKYPTSLEIFKEIVDLHPKTEMLPYLYLRIGAISNDALRDTATARKYYTMVIEKFPNGEYTEGAQFGLETLGMSEEEQFKIILMKSSRLQDSALVQ